MCTFSKNTSLLTVGSSTHKKHRPVTGRATSGAWTVISRFVKRCLKVHGVCQTSYDARAVADEIVRFKFKTKIVRCLIDMCDGCHFTVIDPTKRGTGTVEF